jgi:hypothetical protein
MASPIRPQLGVPHRPGTLPLWLRVIASGLNRRPSPHLSLHRQRPRTWNLAIARHRVHALNEDFLVQLLSLFLLSLPSVLGPGCDTLLLFENLDHLHNLHPLDQLMKVQG